MVLPSDFNTNIHEVLECINSDTFFISNWNKDDRILNLDIDKFKLQGDYHKQKILIFLVMNSRT